MLPWISGVKQGGTGAGGFSVFIIHIFTTIHDGSNRYTHSSISLSVFMPLEVSSFIHRASCIVHHNYVLVPGSEALAGVAVTECQADDRSNL